MPKDILLAVAVHDEAEARLEPTELEEVHFDAGTAPSFRVSYRMADTPQHHEKAHLVVAFRVDGGAWSRQEAGMRDRPLRHNDRLGDITFRVSALEPGQHLLEYRIDFDVSDQGRGAKAPKVRAQSRLEGSLRLVQG